jgi:Phosphotransferase enzyme family
MSEELSRTALERYLSERYGRPVRVRAMALLGDEAGEKGFGYGAPIRLLLEGAPVAEVVVHTVGTSGFGHDTLADRAAAAVLAYETFNNLPRHVRALDVGAFVADGRPVSLGEARDFFLVTEYAEGEPYFLDLERIARTDLLTPSDRHLATRLAAYLAEVHATPEKTPAIYLRRTRELFGHHECILGLLDSYDAFPLTGFTSDAQLREIERRCVDWRHRLKRCTHRLRRVHGDFHPWNVLWRENDEFTLLDRSRGEWGDPADDVSCMVINYLFFSLQAHGRLAGAFEALWRTFFDDYLATTGDAEILRVIPPYFVWRALVIASPLWYHDLDVRVRRALFQFIDGLLQVDELDWRGVNALLTEAPA